MFSKNKGVIKILSEKQVLTLFAIKSLYYKHCRRYFTLLGNNNKETWILQRNEDHTHKKI